MEREPRAAHGGNAPDVEDQYEQSLADPAQVPQEWRDDFDALGKLYCELLEHRRKGGPKNVALVRLEPLYPFPAEQIASELARYPAARVAAFED